MSKKTTDYFKESLMEMIEACGNLTKDVICAGEMANTGGLVSHHWRNTLLKEAGYSILKKYKDKTYISKGRGDDNGIDIALEESLRMGMSRVFICTSIGTDAKDCAYATIVSSRCYVKEAFCVVFRNEDSGVISEVINNNDKAIEERLEQISVECIYKVSLIKKDIRKFGPYI